MSLKRFSRGRAMVTSDVTETIPAVARKLRDSRIGCVVVVRDRRPIGILTDRDLVVRVLAADRAPTSTTVADVVTYDPVLLQENDDIDTAARTMREHGVRRIPIVDLEGNLSGIVTADDLTRLLAEELSDVGASIEANFDSEETR